MKKLVLILFTVITAIAVNAHGGRSELKLELRNGSTFNVVVDGAIRSGPVRFFRLRDLNPGTHRVKVFKNFGPSMGHGHGHGRGHGRGYGRGGNSMLIFNGFVHIRPNTSVFAIVDRFRGLTIIDEFPLRGRRQFNDRGCGPDCSALDHNHGPRNNGMRGGNGRPGGRGFVRGMNDFDFNNLRRSIDNQPFSREKMSIARQALQNNMVSASQVRELMTLFNFDSDKVELTKMAYTSTTDPENYYIVNDGFTFSSSVNDLNQFISGMRG